MMPMGGWTWVERSGHLCVEGKAHRVHIDRPNRALRRGLSTGAILLGTLRIWELSAEER